MTYGNQKGCYQRGWALACTCRIPTALLRIQCKRVSHSRRDKRTQGTCKTLWRIALVQSCMSFENANKAAAPLHRSNNPRFALRLRLPKPGAPKVLGVGEREGPENLSHEGLYELH